MTIPQIPNSTNGIHAVKPLRTLIALTIMVVVFVLIVGYALARFQETAHQPLRPTPQPAGWIRAAGDPSHAGYFRKRFDLPGEVRHAWVKIAATDAFEISVNRNPLGRVFLWRPTRPFQNGSSEKGQVLLPQESAMAMNFPREYQWDGHDTWLLPTYLDLSDAFTQGKNVITIELESRLAPARVALTGEIVLWSGEVIPIGSDETWKAEPAIPGPQFLDWTEPSYWDKEWRTAIAAEAPTQRGYRSHPEEIFTRPFNGNWLRHPSAATTAAVSFTADWKLNQPIDEAYLRLLTNRGYELYINGTRVRVASTRPPDLDNGDWVFGRGASLDPTCKPELLDPDEVGSSFVGKSFESPRTVKEELPTFSKPFVAPISPFRSSRTFNRERAPGEFDPARSLAESRHTPPALKLAPERPRPNSLKHDHATGGYLSYSVANLLKVGHNKIEIRCTKLSNANWPTQIAIDGGALLRSGDQEPFVDESTWTTFTAEDALHFSKVSTVRSEQRPSKAVDGPFRPPWKAVVSETDQFEMNGDIAATQSPVNVQVFGPVAQSGSALPSMQYRGIALHPESFDQLLPKMLSRLAIVTLLALGTILFAARMFDAVRTNKDDVSFETTDVAVPLWLSTSQMIYAMLLTTTVAIGAGLLLECAWVERHEILWYIDGTMWRLIFPLAIVAAFVVGMADTIGRFGWQRLRASGHGLTGCLRDLPNSKIWYHLIVWILLLGALVRGYKLDLQPLDDDEYASTQAVLAIMETGMPSFVPDDVYYTRSPFFHYLTAAIALPFGGDLWSLRLQTVAWSIATAWLVYLCGAHLLGSRWVGLVSMLLICLHPFEIFTGHVIRFYQIQQFFALLTMYFFCRGFVTEPSQKYRIMTLIAFLLAVLSQEISVVMGPTLVLGYLVFAKDLGWSKNFTLALISVAVIAFIGLDFIVFQTLCLTRTEGVSPSIEAAVKPHFWYPLNLLAMLIGYSRLHVVPSFFLIAGLPLLWREQNRNTLAFLTFLISGIVLTNVLVTNVSLRYVYWLFPVWILLSVDGMRLVLSTLVSAVYPADKNLNRHVFALGTGCLICVATILASWSLWRIPGSYELKILGDSTGAVRWVDSQKRPGDRIAITEPHTHCAFIEGEKCDYDLALPLLYDFAVMRDGVLVDRNGGGEVISNIDQMIGEFSDGERIWILLNREKFRARGKKMRWEYPGARFETFVRKNCELKYRTYLWSVYLWDPAAGHYQSFSLQE